MRSFLPTGNHLRLAIVPVLAFVALATDQNYLADFWHHLARGRAIVLDRQLLNHDVFTYTVAGQRFQDVNWLSQILYYQWFELGGLPLVRVVNASFVAVTFALLVNLCRRVSGSVLAATIAGLFAFFGIWEVLTVRPQTFSFLLFVIAFDVLERSERRPSLLCLLPLILALWANLHGAFPAGIMLIGCFLVAKLVASSWSRVRGETQNAPHPALSPKGRGHDEGSPTLAPGERGHGEGSPTLSPRGRGQGEGAPGLRNWMLALCLFASLLATLVNPYGWRIYQYVGLTSNRAATRRIDEWLPPALDSLIGVLWCVSLVVVVGLLAIRWLRLQQRPSVRELVLMGCFLPLAAGSVRMVPWWLIVTAPLVASCLATLLPVLQATSDSDDQPSLASGLMLGVMMLAVVLSLPGLQQYNPLLASRLRAPRLEDNLAAVHARLSRELGTGRVFCRFEWGEYAAWAWFPEFKIYMDARIEIYPDSVWQGYETITRGSAGWERLLDDYKVDALVLDIDYHGKHGLLSKVEASPAWRRVLQSGQVVLYCRTANVDALAGERRPGFSYVRAE